MALVAGSAATATVRSTAWAIGMATVASAAAGLAAGLASGAWASPTSSSASRSRCPWVGVAWGGLRVLVNPILLGAGGGSTGVEE